MPGIAGIINKSRGVKNKFDLNLMVDSLMHESFYNFGTYSNETSGLYVGWSNHQGSFSDCMPIWNEKKNVLMIFFGENYTDLETFDRLKINHHKFQKYNASYIVHLYEEMGDSFLKTLNGWFSGILLDIRKNKILLFNDRYGFQKIFYYASKNIFYFASEAKSILKVCPETRTLDMQSLGDYLSSDCVLEYRTLFKNIRLLPGSSVWEFDQNNRLRKNTYFNPDEWESQPWLEKEFFFEKFRKTLAKVLPRYFRANQRIGISLTGGLDTRVILANFNMGYRKYPCYTFGGIYRDCFDVKVARRVAGKCGQTHQSLPLDDTFLQNFNKYAEKTIYISDGYFGVANSYEIYLNRLARNIAPIRMTGNYGGELLRGIGGMLKAKPFNPKLFSSDIESYFLNTNSNILKLKKSTRHHLTYNLFKEIPLLRNHGFAIEQSQVMPRTPYLDNDLVSLAYRAPVGFLNNLDFSLRLINNGNPELGKILSDRGFGGSLKPPLSNAVELYYAFLVKAEYACDYGMPQWLAAIDHRFRFMRFDKLFLGRHKFAHFRVWYRDELSHYIKSILFDERTLKRPYLNRKYVEEVVNSHTDGKRNYTLEISLLLNIELIQRYLIEN